MRRTSTPVLIAAGLALALTAQAQEALSPRNANYTIDVALDAEAKRLTGKLVLDWTNIQQSPTGELWFHLYWNAWQNDRSTWMLENRLRRRRGLDPDSIRAEDWGWMRVDSARLLSGPPGTPVDLTPTMRFATPDDGDAEDRTVLVLTLPEEVQPGESLSVEMTWKAKIPRTFARTGFRGGYFFFAHWFPKLGVFEGDSWNCHPYHAATEYYSDYGVYDVSMTVPGKMVVGATGREVERRSNDDGTVTHRYRQADVHAFSWTASADYVIREQRFDHETLPGVDIRLLIQPEHLGQADRHFDATRAALEHYGTWYGAYPYGHVTVIDPAWGSGAGGMEYPTLFTCGTRLFNPRGGDSPESVTVHEAGHQFWYGVVGNNEFEHAWIDEGLNTYSTLRTLDTAYGPRQLVRRYLPPPGAGSRRGFLPLRFPDITVNRWVSRLDGYRDAATSDDPDTPTYLYHPGTASNITYSKTALWLRTLENHLGWEEFQPVMAAFFERYRFKHPEPEDFFAVAEEVSGESLDWFFDQVFRDSVVFDYAVDSVETIRHGLRGYRERDGELVYSDGAEEDTDAAQSWRSQVIVRRNGGGWFPVDVVLVFDDGSQLRHRWDGRERWREFVEIREAKLVHAVVDPERRVMLDLNYTNNSLLVEPAPPLAARKWASKWMIWLQDLLTTFAFFV